MRYLRPCLYIRSVQELDLRALTARGIRAIILDLDNTLIAWNAEESRSDLVEWVRGVRSAGFSVCIVSNNLAERVTRFSRLLGIPAIPRAAKPRRSPFKRAMQLMGSTAQETAVVGDQLFTDILGGNRLGLYTILVVPLDRQEFFLTRLMRKLEGWTLDRLEARGWIRRPPRPEG